MCILTRDPVELYDIGKHLLNDAKTNREIIKALKILKRSADKNYVEACYLLGTEILSYSNRYGWQNRDKERDKDLLNKIIWSLSSSPLERNYLGRANKAQQIGNAYLNKAALYGHAKAIAALDSEEAQRKRNIQRRLEEQEREAQKRREEREYYERHPDLKYAKQTAENTSEIRRLMVGRYQSY